MTTPTHFDPGRTSMFAHRILHRLARFSREPSEESGLLSSCHENIAYKAIGIYRVPEIPTEAIVFLVDGLLMVHDRECTRIRFVEIVSVELDAAEEKHVAEGILITMRDSAVHRIYVRGGSGKLRDVYEVFRYIRSVIRGQNSLQNRLD